mgnify:CR=1 FL=1
MPWWCSCFYAPRDKTLTYDDPSLAPLGWTPFFARARQQAGRPDLLPARVASDLGQTLHLLTPDGRRTARGHPDAAVGDWVLLDLPDGDAPATVVEVLDADQHPRSGETVRVLHRPGLAGEEEQAIGITDGRGRVSWTPSSPGVAVVRAGEEREAVHIATTTPRLDTWLLLVLLGLAGASSLAISTWKRP